MAITTINSGGIKDGSITNSDISSSAAIASSKLTGTASAIGDLSDATTTATSNLGLGTGAVNSITTGDYNVGVGDNALTSVSSGEKNVAIGFNALTANTTASNNTAIGMRALDATTTGQQNTGVGADVLGANTTGSSNTATGYQALYSNTTGYDNTAIGINALKGNTTGIGNIAIGDEAGYAGVTNTTGDQNIFIGRFAHGPDADAAHCQVLGYNVGGANSTFTFGESATDTRCAHGSTTWTTPSDERYKKEIVDAEAGLGFINDLRPVTYKWRDKGDVPVDHQAYEEGSTDSVNGTKETQHGFIAQEVKAAIDSHPEIKEGFDMWAEDADGRQRLGETALIPMLVKAIQELSAKVEALENNA